METKKNILSMVIKQAVFFVIVTIACLAIIFISSIVAGSSYNNFSHTYDRPMTNICYHDHRI